MSQPPGPSARQRHFYVRALPAYWLFLFCVTHFPKLELGGPPNSDKYSHFVAFGLLALLLWKFCESGREPLSTWFIWKALLGIGLYAAFDELTQSLVGRGADAADWIADMTGAGLVLALLEWRRRARRRPSHA